MQIILNSVGRDNALKSLKSDLENFLPNLSSDHQIQWMTYCVGFENKRIDFISSLCFSTHIHKLEILDFKQYKIEVQFRKIKAIYRSTPFEKDEQDEFINIVRQYIKPEEELKPDRINFDNLYISPVPLRPIFNHHLYRKPKLY